jgi:hypothetical protein
MLTLSLSANDFPRQPLGAGCVNLPARPIGRVELGGLPHHLMDMPGYLDMYLRSTLSLLSSFHLTRVLLYIILTIIWSVLWYIIETNLARGIHE